MRARRASFFAFLAVLGLPHPPVVHADHPAPAELPLKRVALFSSGVGFFEHQAEIEGDKKVDLQFRTEDVNDLLKSMVLQDLAGGKVAAVSYGSKDPIEKTLKTFAIDLTSHPTLADLLRQVRGEKVTIEADRPITGTIVGVEKRRQQVGKDEVIEAEYVNLLTAEGLRSVSLQSVGLIRFENPSLDAEFRQALEILALAHATDKKTVTLDFTGEGKRPVRVGYIQNSPIWKTSYRLVLGEKPLLQGWAIVENTTEEDWKEVDLTLISGRPISFVMNLYDPLYVERPVVEPELFASLRPQKYEQDMAKRRVVGFAQSSFGIEGTVDPQTPPSEKEAGVGGFGGVKAEGLGGGGFGRVQIEGNEVTQSRVVRNIDDGNHVRGVTVEGKQISEEAMKEWEAGIRYRRKMLADSGVESAAQASELGQLFQYKIEAPVSLARQRSAMLPIVNEAVEAEELSIYNPAVHAKHPLHGLRLKNSTKLHLMQGPITVFDDGAYAGDAQIEDLPPGGDRLVSYAIDLDVEVAPEAKAQPEELTAVKIVKGVLQAERKYRRETKYVVKNSGDEKIKLLIESPVETEWKLVAPENPAEKTRALYRFAVEAEPGKPTELLVVQELTQRQDAAVIRLDQEAIAFYSSSSAVDAKVKEALAEIVARKTKLAEVNAKLEQTKGQIASITTEQSRIRQNMQTIDKTSDLYRRYVKKFGDQEDEVEKLQQDVADLAEELRRLQADMEKFVGELGVD